MGPEDLVSVSEIATRAGVKPDTVHKWRQRHSDFPSPFTTVGGVPVWVWPDIESWLSVERLPGRPSTSP